MASRAEKEVRKHRSSTVLWSVYCLIIRSSIACQGRRAVDSLKEKGYSASFLKLDVTSTDDIMQAASYFKESETRLDLLINNAGVCIRVRTALPTPHTSGTFPSY